MTSKRKRIVLLLSIILLVFLPACNALAERLAAGTLEAARTPGGESEFTLAVSELPEGEGVGGGDSGEEEDDDDLSDPGGIGTAIQKTNMAASLTALVGDDDSPTSSPTLNSTQTPTPTVNSSQTATQDETLASLKTSLAETLTAIVVSTTPTSGTLTPGGTDSQTQTPTETPQDFTPSPTTTPCNAFQFVGYAGTLSPGSIVQPNQRFEWYWYIKNVGSCTWTSSYALVFYDGFMLNAQSPVYLPSGTYVGPGQYITLKMVFYTPPQPKTYTSFWKLQDGSGNVFGGGPNSDDPLYVEVYVPGQQQPLFTDSAATAPPFYTSTPGP